MKIYKAREVAAAAGIQSKHVWRDVKRYGIGGNRMKTAKRIYYFLYYFLYALNFRVHGVYINSPALAWQLAKVASE